MATRRRLFELVVGVFSHLTNWRKYSGSYNSDLKVSVNGRENYFSGFANPCGKEISGGITYENFDMIEKYYDNQKFWFGYEYEILPTRYPKGWTVEMTLKPRLVDAYLPPSGQTTLNDFYPDNAGIFFYMGTRAENKFWHDANGKNQGDPNYQRVTESLTGLSSCMCEILNSGYTTTSYTNIPIRVSGATIVVEPNLLWMSGDTVLVYHDLLQYIEGIVESYNTVSGELKFVSTKNVGTGNFPYWRVDKPNYLEYAESYCVKVYPETGYTSGNSITYCSCCVPPPPKPPL